VIRRALLLYVKHLEAITEPQEEVRAVVRASKALPSSKQDQRDAKLRLEDASNSLPLPSFNDLLTGPNRLNFESLDNEVDFLINQMAQTPLGRLKKLI
jgi:hypothetical protein